MITPLAESPRMFKPIPAAELIPIVCAGCTQSGTPLVYHVDLYVDSVVITALIAGCIGSMPWLARVKAWHADLDRKGSPGLQVGLEIQRIVICSAAAAVEIEYPERGIIGTDKCALESVEINPDARWIAGVAGTLYPRAVLH